MGNLATWETCELSTKLAAKVSVVSIPVMSDVLRS